MGGEIVHEGDTGRAIVATTGTPVDTILEALQSGDSHEDVLRAHPGLIADDIVAAVRFARGAVQRGVRYTSADEMPRTEPFMARETAVAWDPVSEPGRHRHPDVRSALKSAERQRERLAYRLDLMDSIRDGLAQASVGDVIPHKEVVARLRARFPG
ncbi:MAG TPA: DUF433 domain-containing protein [Longimicrobium sp.]|nr:DUF433 domain-containing protein [Longimicrobium sp.]